MNNIIEDNLKHYLQTTDPKYAFLITGEWGVGKTYFIEHFIKKNNTKLIKEKIILISLFGLKNTSDINEKIFEELHPTLSSKAFKMINPFIKGGVSLGFKFDSDLSVTLKLPEILSINNGSNNKNHNITIVFDDLERTLIDIKELLGFINYLVDKCSTKVILIANENKIKQGDDNTEIDNIYLDFKERVIGKTFKITHDFDEILNETLKNISYKELINHTDIIKDIYIKSNCKNIRKIKQTISDFIYFSSKIDDNFTKNNEYYRTLLRNYFVLSLALKSNDSSINDIPSIFKDYQTNNHYLFDKKTWEDILINNDFSKINTKNSQLNYFIENKKNIKPIWEELYYYTNMEDDEFKHKINQLICDFNFIQEKDIHTFLHQVSLLILFSENNLVDITKSEIKSIVSQYLKKNKHNQSWLDSYCLSHSSYGYYYICHDNNNFIAIQKSLSNEINKINEKQNKTKQNKTKN